MMSFVYATAKEDAKTFFLRIENKYATLVW